MGGGSSKRSRRTYSSDSSSSMSSESTPQRVAHPETSNAGGALMRVVGAQSFTAIRDRFTSVREVTNALKQAGLESSNLIFAIDYTLSNMQQGQRTFNGRSLHSLQEGLLNPYQSVILYLGETLAPFDEDGKIPAFGFGDVQTKDRGVFSLKEDGACDGFAEVLECYNRVTPFVKMSGPTNFAPAIYASVDIVRRTKQYHILVIVADGQVTSEEETINAIVEASKYPLSIIVVGVGDGPWEMMEEFDDQLPQRMFDNFQFVDFSSVIADARNPQTAFAVASLMEIPDQYNAIRRLRLLEKLQ